MNFLKKSLAFIISMLISVSCFSFVVSADASAEVGTKDNPENANDRYFSATNCYLLNMDLAEGDSDGYWFEFTAESAGYFALDVTARDSAYNVIEDFQVSVECAGKTYYAFDKIFTRPIVPYRMSRGDVMKIHITATPQTNGVYPKLKIYANITQVYGNSNDPIMIKSTEGFIANVQTQKTVVYIDGTNGGLYGGKGIEVYAGKYALSETEVTLNSVVYKDTDNDGKIELTLPGDPNAMIAVHPTFSIYNGSKIDESYVIKVVDKASESEAPAVCSHSLTHYEKKAACHKNGMGEYWYCSKCDSYFSDSAAKTLTDPALLTLAATEKLQLVSAKEPTCAENGTAEHWSCKVCGECFSDQDGKNEVKAEDMMIPKIPHDLSFAGTVKLPTIYEEGEDLYICAVCGAEESVPVPTLERWMKGDINNDGAINSIDANFLKRALVGYTLSEQARDAADVDGNGEVNAVDSFLQRKVISGLD